MLASEHVGEYADRYSSLLISEYIGGYAGMYSSLLISEYIGGYAGRHSKNKEHIIDSSGRSVAPEKTAILFLDDIVR